MKTALYIVLLAAVAVAILFFLGPRPDNDDSVTFSADAIGDDLDAYLERTEAAVENLRPGAEKQIVWHYSTSRQPTELGIIYVHGFSATNREIRPVPDRVAQALKANLYFARLAGHGRDGPAMGEATMGVWANDMAEAIAIGRKFAKKLIIIGTSTGGTLASWAAAHPELSEDIAGLVLISPNYALQDISTGMMNMPWAETILPMIGGRERSWEPRNEQQGKWWTTRYPTKAIFPMGALLAKVEAIDKSGIDIPALFIFSNADKVVSPEATQEVASQWGGDVQVMKIDTPDDPFSHVITGDILSPTTTEPVANRIVDWIKGL